MIEYPDFVSYQRREPRSVAIYIRFSIFPLPLRLPLHHVDEVARVMNSGLTTTPPIPLGKTPSTLANRFTIRSSTLKRSRSPPCSLSSPSSPTSSSPPTTVLFIGVNTPLLAFPLVHNPLRGVLLPFPDVLADPPFKYPFLNDSCIASAHQDVFAAYPVGFDSRCEEEEA